MKHALRLRDDARAGRLSLDGLGEAVEALAARLARRLTRPGPLADVQRFAAHLTREWTALFNFLRNPAIDATNWRAYFAEVEHRARAAFRGEEERRARLVAELRKARLTGIRVKVPAEALDGKLVSLPEGVSVAEIGSTCGSAGRRTRWGGSTRWSTRS